MLVTQARPSRCPATTRGTTRPPPSAESEEKANEPKAVAFGKPAKTDRLADKENLLSILKDRTAQILDARSNDEYCGAAGKATRLGHIPGVILGAFAFVLGFAVVWHIWWLVIVAALIMFAAVITRSSDDNAEFTLSAGEVKRIEDERFRQLGGRA